MTEVIKSCIATGCTIELGTWPPMCWEHWGSLPDELQDEVRAANLENNASTVLTHRYWKSLETVRRYVDGECTCSGEGHCSWCRESSQPLTPQDEDECACGGLGLCAWCYKSSPRPDRQGDAVMSVKRFVKVLEVDPESVYDAIAAFVVPLIKRAAPDGTTLIHLAKITAAVMKRLKEGPHE